MSVCDRNQGSGGAGRNKQLERYRFRIDLDVVETCNLVCNSFAQLADTFGGAVMIAACANQSTGRLGQRGINRKLGLSLDQISAWRDEPGNSSDFGLGS